MSFNEVIHYSSTLSLMKLKSTGEGECGKTGYISGYKVAINCKSCLRIYAKDRQKALNVINRVKET